MKYTPEQLKRAVIVTAQGFDDSELIYAYYRLQEEGFLVDIATKDKKDIVGKHGCSMQASIDTKMLREENYQVVIVPGGYEGPDRTRQIPEVLQFLRDMHAKGKVISAICHGPVVLVSAGILKGKRATAYNGCKDDLVNAGVLFEEASVVVDGNIITSPHYKDMPSWMKKTMEKLS